MSANNRQEGGSHYAAGGNRYQHWDYTVRALDNSYLEGCLTKYVMRSRFKGTPLNDLKKARHYAEKLIEESNAGEVSPLFNHHYRELTFDIGRMSRMHELNDEEHEILVRVANWRSVDDILHIVGVIDHLIALASPQAGGQASHPTE